MIHGMLIGAGIGALFILVRDICFCFSPNMNSRCSVFLMAMYLKHSIIGAIIGLLASVLWQLGV